MDLQFLIINGAKGVGKWTFADSFEEAAENENNFVITLDESELSYEALVLCGARSSDKVDALQAQLTTMSIRTGRLFHHFQNKIDEILAGYKDQFSEYKKIYISITITDPTRIESSINGLMTSVAEKWGLNLLPELKILLKRKKIIDPKLTEIYNKQNFDYKLELTEGKEHSNKAGKGFLKLLKDAE